MAYDYKNRNKSRKQNSSRYNDDGGNHRKHSGAQAGRFNSKTLGDGVPYVIAWNYSKRYGMVKFIAAPTKKTKRVSSHSGKEWDNWVVKVQIGWHQPYLTGGLYEVATGRVIVKDLGIVINPKAPNGGYCGTFVNKR